MRYLQVKCILVRIQTLWEKAGHELVDVCNLGYFQGAELKQVETVALPQSHLVHLWRQRIISLLERLHGVWPDVLLCGLPLSQRENLRRAACALHTSWKGVDVCTSSISLQGS